MGALGDWRSRPRKHGHNARGNRTPTYESWCAMHARCRHETQSNGYSYGVAIAERWCGEDGFENFVADMGMRPEGMTLDRKDHAEPYGPGNCRWATKEQQSRNRRSVKLTEDDVREIRRRLAAGASGRDIVRAYNVSDTVVSAIRHRRTWKEI